MSRRKLLIAVAVAGISVTGMTTAAFAGACSLCDAALGVAGSTGIVPVPDLVYQVADQVPLDSTVHQVTVLSGRPGPENAYNYAVSRVNSLQYLDHPGPGDLPPIDSPALQKAKAEANYVVQYVKDQLPVSEGGLPHP
jgi:hypothetical protein